jgi:DNA-binding response OmpR family regulator
MGRADRDVLIVEDDPSVAQAIADGVRLAGYTVCAICTTAAAALEEMRQRRPRVAVIDVELEDELNGVDAARELLRIGPIGVLYITGFPDLVRTADVGHAWMEKPYRVLDLINALEVVRALSEGRALDVPLPPALNLIG